MIKTRFVLLYLACYVVTGLIAQLLSETPPWVDNSSLEYFTGSCLWMLSLVSLLFANFYTSIRWRLLLWLAASASLALLALDERFAFHEATQKMIGDDDYIKVLLWIMAAAVLYLICRLESPSLKTIYALSLGYFVHGLYILVRT